MRGLPRGPGAGQLLLCDVLLPRWDRPLLCGSSHLGLPEESLRGVGGVRGEGRGRPQSAPGA